MNIPKKRAVPRAKPAPRKQRAAPRQSERATRRYATAVEFAMEGYAAVSLDGRLLKVNSAMCALTGYSRAELLRFQIADLEAKETSAEIDGHIARLVASGNERFESRWKRRDGTIIDVAVAVTYVAGGAGELFCFARDITRQKLADRSARNLSRVVEQSPSLILITDIEGNIEYVNPTFTRVTGYSLAEVIGKNPRFLRSSTSSPEEYPGLWKTIASGGTWRGEFCNRKKNGDLYWEDALISGVQDEAGVITNLVAVKLDITERKRMEAALRESEERYRDLVEYSHDLICTHNLQGKLMSVNAAAVRLTEYSPEALLRMNLVDLLAQGARADFPDYLAEIRTKGAARGLMKIRTAGGKTRWWEYNNTLRTEGVAEPVVRGMAQDVTERKRAEDELKRRDESLRRFRVAMDATADAIYLVDRANMRFIDVNAAACRMREQTREEIFALGPHGLLSRSREELEREYDDLIAHGGKSEKIEVQRQGKDGSQFTIELKRSAQRTGEGWMIVTLARDMTERKREETAARQSADALRTAFRRLAHAQETERRKLAAELHDQVGQDLSALHLNLMVIGQELSNETNAKVKARLEDSVVMTRQVSEQIRNVMGQLRPPMLDDYGLFATLRWLAHQTSQRSGITCVLDWEEPAERLPGEIESALLRISQEALTNAVKYSKASWISLTLTTTPGRIRLEISDDGRGFDVAAFAAGPQLSWGIRTMRERAQSLGGRLEIESAPGKGTRIMAEVPTA